MTVPVKEPPTSPTGNLPVEVEVSSEWLLKDAKTLAISHAGDRYFLRITRQNKLILTK